MLSSTSKQYKPVQTSKNFTGRKNIHLLRGFFELKMMQETDFLQSNVVKLTVNTMGFPLAMQIRNRVSGISKNSSLKNLIQIFMK